ncbi:MAG: PqiC family protein [Chthoniobacterales bacterium]
MKQSLPLLFCAGVLCLLTACGSSDKFFRLSASESAPVGSASGLSVSIGPVSLPSYIDRSELVFQSGPNEYQLPPHQHWIGSLSENISRVLAADLGAVLHSARVHSALEAKSGATYRVALEIHQFHGISGQEAVLDLSWKIQDASGATISRHSGTFREPIVGDGYEPLVAAESRLLAQCARAIGASLR